MRAGNLPSHHENHWQAKDGSRHLIDWSGSALFLPDGGIEFVIGTGIDITERKRAEAGIAYQAQLLGQVQYGIIGADPETHITYWNRGAERMYGFTEAEALGKTTTELLRPDYAPGEREKIMAELARLGTAKATVRTKHKNGAGVMAEVHSHLRPTDESGRYLRMRRRLQRHHRAEAY